MSLESLLVVVALLSEVTLEPHVVNFQMAAEILNQGSFIVTLVGLPGEVAEVYVGLPQPVLGGLEADHALVTPPHRHGYWKN